MASHEELISELPRLEKLSNAARLKLAKKRRVKQLKKYAEYTRISRQTSRPERTTTCRVNFAQNALLHEAVARNDTTEVERLLRDSVNPNDSNADGLTPLHRCCIDNSLDMARILVLNGADLNARDIEGWSPLHAAAACGNLQLINIMVDSGADLMALNHDGNMPVDVSSDSDIQYILQQKMLESGYTDDTCQYARESVSKTMLADLKDSIQSGRSLNIQDKYGATALHVAAANGYMDVLEFLLSQDEINMNIQDHEGWTPFHGAVCWAQKEAMEKLAAKGVNMDIENIHGETPYAVTDVPEVRQFILELKAKYSVVNPAKAEPEDEAKPDRANTPDLSDEFVDENRYRRRSLSARRSSTLKKDLLKKDSAVSERLIRQETMDQEDIARSMSGMAAEPMPEDSLTPTTKTAFETEETAFDTSQSQASLEHTTLNSQVCLLKKEELEINENDAKPKLSRDQLKSVLKKTGKTPVLENDEPNFESVDIKRSRQTKRECCVIS